MFTCVVGILFATLFPKSLFEPKSAFGFRYFTDREADILHRRIIFDDPRKLQEKKWIDWAELRNAVRITPSSTYEGSLTAALPYSSPTGGCIPTSCSR